MNFVCANEDTNLYTFDLRNLNQVSFFLSVFIFRRVAVPLIGTL